MPGIFYPNAGALEKADVLKTALAGGKIHLFKSDFVPLVNSTEAEFNANECDYDGYTAGGITIANWLSPLLDPSGGASIEMPITQFTFVAGGGTPVTNTVGGWYYTTSGGMLICGEFPQPIPMQANGQGIPLSIKLVEATGQ